MTLVAICCVAIAVHEHTTWNVLILLLRFEPFLLFAHISLFFGGSTDLFYLSAPFHFKSSVHHLGIGNVQVVVRNKLA